MPYFLFLLLVSPCCCVLPSSFSPSFFSSFFSFSSARVIVSSLSPYFVLAWTLGELEVRRVESTVTCEDNTNNSNKHNMLYRPQASVLIRPFLVSFLNPQMIYIAIAFAPRSSHNFERLPIYNTASYAYYISVIEVPSFRTDGGCFDISARRATGKLRVGAKKKSA